MTTEQYYWFIRRRQLLQAYNTQYKNVAGNSNERTLKPNLKEYWFNDFIEQFDIIPDIPNIKFASKFSRSMFGGCSSVRRGNFHGRNFDFTFDPRTTYVVHVKENKSKGRHAFAGIAKASFNDDTPDMNKMPNLLKDGINDCGVAININVVSRIDLVEAKLENTETNPDKGLLRVHCDCVPSYVLSYASSAVDAINLMKNNINIYGYLKSDNPDPEIAAESDEYLHFMISDPKDTFVVEIIGNKLHVVGYKMNDPKDNDLVGAKVKPEAYPNPIMTNWYLNYDEMPSSSILKEDKYGKYTYHGCGVERFRILSDNYDTAKSVFDLMKMVRYTNAILMNVDDPNFTFSDLTGRSIYDYQMYLDYPELKAFVDSERDKMQYALKNNVRNLGIWLTSHNTVYDLQNKTFTLVFEEDYEHPMNFEL